MVPLLNELKRLGTLIIFGSIINKPIDRCNDLDVAVVVPDGCLQHAEKKIKKIIEKMPLNNHVLIQKLFAYERHNSDKQSKFFLHVLLCEQKDLTSDHPIVTSLNKGITMKFRNVA